METLIVKLLVSNIPLVVTGLLGLAVVWRYAKHVLSIMKETQEFLMAAVVALSDRKLTKKEMDNLIKEGEDVIDAFKRAMAEKKKK